ncbi:MAG TPA: ADP-ribosylglycohydrolase family protein [Armatimonadota bacterium]|jgi:ADP-ribosylglycohydrolase
MRVRALVALSLASASALAAPTLSAARYQDKVRGAWTGKCIGGALGMPLEGWRSADIRAKYPNLNGYVGYFSGAQAGWSGFLAETLIPKGGDWRTVTLRATVPSFNTSTTLASPIIGLSLERYSAKESYELRNVRVLRPENDASFRQSDWSTASACWWTDEGSVKADFTGERAWLKMRDDAAHRLKLLPGQQILISMEARHLSGDNRLGLALDYLTMAPRTGFGPDDDTSYQITGLLALERNGPDLTAREIGQEWVRTLPAIDASLAEGLALQRMRSGILPPESGQHPIGEAIGGQMKGEIWGLICPGRPDLAAEYARRDGVVAHQKNGVYGEQFVAAMTAQAFVESDVHHLIDAGLRQVPPDSEYAAVVKSVIDAHRAGRAWPDALKQITDKYPGICNPVFAEAGIVTLALLYGDGDFDTTITIAAQCGNDTDCNTATVASLIGCIDGWRAIPARWKAPIGDDFRCFVQGAEEWKISRLTKRITAAGGKVRAFHGDGMRFTAPM